MVKEGLVKCLFCESTELIEKKEKKMKATFLIVIICVLCCLALFSLEPYSQKKTFNVSSINDCWDVEAMNIAHLNVKYSETYIVSVSGSVNYGGGTSISDVYIYGAGSAFFGVISAGQTIRVSNVTELYGFLSDNGKNDNSGHLTISIIND